MSEIISVEAREITDYEEAFRTHQRIMANGTIPHRLCLRFVKI